MDDLNKPVSEIENVPKISDVVEPLESVEPPTYGNSLMRGQLDEIADLIRSESAKTSRQNRIAIILGIITAVLAFIGLLK